MSVSDQTQEAQGKTIQFGIGQFNNPTPTILKKVFRAILYASVIWSVGSPIFTDIPPHIHAIINKYLLFGNGLVNVSIKFFGWDYQSGIKTVTHK